MSDPLSIIINNIQFTLIYKTTTYKTGEYDHATSNTLRRAGFSMAQSLGTKDITSDIIKIKSLNLTNNNEIFFWVYSSMSELGIWRLLCYIIKNDEIMPTTEKGLDYAQSSCVNILLQKHISLQYNSLPLIESSQNPDIKFLNSVQPQFKKITSEVINIPLQDNNNNSDLLKDFKRQKTIITGSFVNCGELVFEQLLRDQIQRISNVLSFNYTIIETKEVFRYNFLFYDTIQTENIIIQVILENNKSKKKIILFYKKMFFSTHPSPLLKDPIKSNVEKITEPNNVHFTIFLAIPYESTCMENSIYSKYIPLGVYICKPFEYTKQVKDKFEITSYYSYVANRYVNDVGIPVFPINQSEEILKKIEMEITQRTKPFLIEDDETNFNDERYFGGKKKKRKTKKYKKYKKYKINKKRKTKNKKI
jgi:hypothetical protein